MTRKTRQRQRKDRRMKVVVTAFGALVLLTLIVLIAHLVSQAVPLLYTPGLQLQAQYKLPADTQLVAPADILERQPVLLHSSDCAVQHATLSGSAQTNASAGTAAQWQTGPPLRWSCRNQTRVVSYQNQAYQISVTPAGILQWRGLHSVPMPAALSISANQPDSVALPTAQWRQTRRWQVSLGRDWLVLQLHHEKGTHVHWINRHQPEQTYTFSLGTGYRILPLPDTGQQMIHSGDTLVMQNYQGQLQARTNVHSDITWWQSLPKDRTVIMADRTGSVTRWVLQNRQGQMIYQPTYTLHLAQSEQPAAVAVHPSANALLLATTSKRLLILNRITGEVVGNSRSQKKVTGLRWYGEYLYAYNHQQIEVYQTQNLSGVTTWSALFEPQLYEGYLTARHTWQSATATDYQEQKFSLTPLLRGSIKASLLALIIAIPTALSAAIYTGFFATGAVRQWLKPAVEMLEAIPSVLIGFIAAIWLAPLATHILLALVFFVVTLPVVLMAIVLLKPWVALYVNRWAQGTELVLAVLVILAFAGVAIQLTPWLLSVFASIDGQMTSLLDAPSPLGKTSVVVAIALGLAVAPSIYSLAEDAIYSVPEGLKHASFALGATSLQTLYKVVLHVASPGIFAAIMLGFGRAFGETMIVLMVTGNTPIASWSLFEGLRALTANLAIELPESEVSSAHYQILFFTACLLFGFTFVINTLAELLRQRLRKAPRHG
ncbi:ABC transporter permease subunit [Salinimonas marina]|uniref:ABC transporter permease subunit n=2 Tax=Salinimonas marina TaxID=2785918 RepID=A0A7S9HEH3_9ALTE|nr:ABC transporter permease subunit [Salinimonas marina]